MLSFVRRGVAPLLLLLAFCNAPARAEPTHYPLTLRNCGQELRFPAPPRRVVSLGQSTTETLLALGLADRIVGTAVWFGPVQPQFAAANAGIPRLADNDPSFEAVVGRAPDLVAAQYQWHVGPRGSVAKPEQFAALGIPAYVAPADCAAKDNAGSGDGVRREPLTLAPIAQEIRELAAIFDVSDRGEALVASLENRAAQAKSRIADVPDGIPVVVWFSSREVAGDAFVAGRNGAPAYLLDRLGERNVVTVDDEWPTVSWEAIVKANPAVIVVAQMDRRRFPADAVETKLRFLRADPVVSRLEAVRMNRIVVMDAQAMNPGLRMVDGIEALADGIRSFGFER